MLVAISLIVAMGTGGVTDASIPESGEQVNRAMGMGFNIGNTFDLGLNSTDLKDLRPLIDLYQAAGMKHVRIPVTWGSPAKAKVMADLEGNIDKSHPRLAELKQVVDYALGKGLYVVINCHHEHWLKDHYDGSSKYNDAFKNLWTGIANEFKGKSQKLVFETLNEPEKAFGDWSGPVKPSDPKGLAATRAINEIAWKAIRATGGPNITRVVMFGVNGLGNHSQLAVVYPDKRSLPGGGADEYLIATVHTYDPWDFCGENGSIEKWPGEAAIENPIRSVGKHARRIGVPVNYGEFGVGRSKNPGERGSSIVKSYYLTVVSALREQKMSGTVWDDHGWFGLTTRTNTGWEFTYGLVPAIMARS